MLVAQVKHLNDEAMLHRELRLIIGRLEEFAQKVSNGLEQASWDTQREIIRTLVKRVEVDEEQVNVVFRVEPGSGVPHPEPAILPDCGRRDDPTLWCSLLSLGEYSFVHHP